MNTTKNSEKKHRIALLIQYDGSVFNGWQSQKQGRPVQDEIEKAMEVLFKEKIRTVAAGRTDAGVHALGQVIHFDTSSKLTLKKICGSLNGILAKDVAVRNAYYVPPDFHARFSAVQREYVYAIYNYPQRNPLIINKAQWVSYKLDIAFLKNIAQYFIGENDFASFCKKTSAEENTVRRIDEFDITEFEDFIFFRIKGNGFLHNMVRIIIGTILDVCVNKIDPDSIPDIFKKKDRDASGKTAPPYGLYLNKIFYNPALSEMESAF